MFASLVKCVLAVVRVLATGLVLMVPLKFHSTVNCCRTVQLMLRPCYVNTYGERSNG